MHARSGAARTFIRFDLLQRLQHLAMIVSFTLLALTGLPMRFPDVAWLGTIYSVVGGLAAARQIHRWAAVLMMADGAVHAAYLLVLLARSGFRVREAWPMLPNWKDARDWWETTRYYFGLRDTLPAYDRFSFREKFDYFAVFWGLPVMMISGLILWFPVWFGNRLPDIAIPMAYIAHSDEAVLAISAIVVWHFYNVHFNPDKFPMSWVWLTGRISEHDIRHEHPLEYERLISGQGKPS
ncbi:MAG: formate dehydrogenase subunit gamma [Vicinamibacterales bacterium]